MDTADIFIRALTRKMRPHFHPSTGAMLAQLGDGIRIHVWHPDFPPNLELFGNRRDHCRDQHVTILKGNLVEMTYDLDPAFHTGPFRLYTVAKDGKGVTLLDDIRYNPKLRAADRRPEGSTFVLPGSTLHETRPEGMVVALVRNGVLRRQEARVAAFVDQDPYRRDARHYSQDQVDRAYFYALRQLSEQAWTLIERETSNG
jgi:hypothetical protein